MSLRNKLFGAAVAASMITGAVIPAMAATITIQHAQSGEEYKAYKIFDIIVNDTDSNTETITPDGFAYTISKTDQFYNWISTYATTYGLKLTGIESSKGTDGQASKFVVEKLDTFNAATFAAALLSEIGNPDTSYDTSYTGQTTEGSSVATINVSEDTGYYLVDTSSNPALAGLITVYDNITIADKSAQYFTKSVNDQFLAVGDTAAYTLETTIPYVTATETTFNLQISDTLPTGVDLNENNIKVTVDGTPVTDAVTPGKDGNSFVVNLDLKANSYNPGDVVKVEYTAELKSNATFSTASTDSANGGNEGNENKAILTYPGVTLYSNAVKVYSLSVNVNKYEPGENEAQTPLANAKFKLKRVIPASDVDSNETTDKTQYYRRTNGEISWVDSFDDAIEFVTNASGAFDTQLNGLDKDETYYLIETEAPAGYNIETDPIQVSFGESMNVNSSASMATTIVNVANRKGVQLPETGGMGTTLFYIAGGTLVAGAAVLLITKKRMSEAE